MCVLVLNMSKVGADAIYEKLAFQIRYQSDPFSSFGELEQRLVWFNFVFLFPFKTLIDVQTQTKSGLAIFIQLLKYIQ